MFYARYRATRINSKSIKKDIIDERWIGIDTSKKNIAKERAETLVLPGDRFLPEDCDIVIDIFDEKDMLDLRLDRAYSIEKLTDKKASPREIVLSEIINLLRETVNDINKRMTVRDEDNYIVEVIRIEDLVDALNSSINDRAYLTNQPLAFKKERDFIIKNLFSIRKSKVAGIRRKKISENNNPSRKKTTKKKTSKRK